MERGMMIDMDRCKEGTTYYKTELNIWENVSGLSKRKITN